MQGIILLLQPLTPLQLWHWRRSGMPAHRRLRPRTSQVSPTFSSPGMHPQSPLPSPPLSYVIPSPGMHLSPAVSLAFSSPPPPPPQALPAGAVPRQAAANSRWHLRKDRVCVLGCCGSPPHKAVPEVGHQARPHHAPSMLRLLLWSGDAGAGHGEPAADKELSDCHARPPA